MCSNFHHRVESTSHTCARTGAAILRESQLSHRVAFSFLLVLLIVVASPKENFAQRPCEDLARLSLTNVTITSATSLAAGTFKPPSDPHEPLPAPAYPPSAAYRASSDRRALRRSGLKCGCQSQAGTASSNRSATAVWRAPSRSLIWRNRCSEALRPPVPTTATPVTSSTELGNRPPRKSYRLRISSGPRDIRPGQGDLA